MKMVLVGHRGTGKSMLLDRMKNYFSETHPRLKFFDLDREIEFREGRTVHQIFDTDGEDHFRALEVQVFKDLVRVQEQFVISLGAGFLLSEIPEGISRLWVRRRTDLLGRIFLNRPRLNRSTSPLEEYLERVPLREERYRTYSDDQYLMPEGLDENPNSFEKKIFLNDFRGLGGILTILPTHFDSEESLLKRIRNFECDFFELRDDLLNISQIQKITTLIPKNRTLISFRQESPHHWLKEYVKTGVLWDWATELGRCHWGVPPILSIHRMDTKILKNRKSFDQYLKEMAIDETLTKIKLSPVVETFQQLDFLIEWQQEKPQQRSFLPRSRDGRWNWVRLWLKGRQLINFFRTDHGSALDQPTVFEWMASPYSPRAFAAVLGQPVFHSRTPIEHQTYFLNKLMPVFGIAIEESQFDDAISLLSRLGLSHAAVTSPLKTKAFRVAQKASPLSKELQSANTLVRSGGWNCHNTDLEGFRALFSHVNSQSQSVGVWGGGGTLPVIHKVAPQAFCFSARTGDIKREFGDRQQWTRDELVSMKLEGPEVLIWAASPESTWPPTEWKPEFVIDLNYREDSMAREYALQVGAQYMDGLLMFQEQAKAQREYWDRF